MKILRVSLLSFILILAVTNIVFSDELKVRVISPNAHIKLLPETQSETIYTPPLGAYLDVIEQKEDWYLVRLPADDKGIVITGYISEKMVEVTKGNIDDFKEERMQKEIPIEDIPLVKKETELSKESLMGMEGQETAVAKAPKRMAFRASLGIAIPSGDWSDLFNLGLGASAGNSFSIVRHSMFDLDIMGTIGAVIFFREAGYTDINWTRISLAGDLRLNLKLDQLRLFGQGGLGLYLDILEIVTWPWKEEGSEFRIGPRIGGGIGLGNFEIVAMQHLVKDNMFTMMASLVLRF